MKKLITGFILLSIFSVSTVAAPVGDSKDVQATYKDIKQTLGIVPSFMKNYSKDAITGAWQDIKGIQLNSMSVIPGKYKELMGIAVSAQIPCKFCAYFHTSAAKLNKATTQEIQEAINLAAGARRWSTFFMGLQFDMGQFRSEVDKALLFMNKSRNLQAMEVRPTPEEIQINTPEDVYKDAARTMGFVPHFITQYPKSGIVGAWQEMKGVEMNPDSAIPEKYKQLIGLAIASQIPCPYSIYYTTQAAMMSGATNVEIAETAAVAGTIRSWSAAIHGQMTEEMQFRKEVDQMIKYLKSKAPKEVGMFN